MQGSECIGFKSEASSSANHTQLKKAAGACALELRRTALIQLAYCALVGTFPFNSFLAGFLSTVGMLVLTVCLRMQVVSGTVTAQRAWAEYAVANAVLHLAVLNFRADLEGGEQHFFYWTHAGSGSGSGCAAEVWRA
eukprot:COSAG04_NODE_1795_length_5563_cov_9.186493_9_plen_137_part_00